MRGARPAARPSLVERDGRAGRHIAYCEEGRKAIRHGIPTRHTGEYLHLNQLLRQPEQRLDKRRRGLGVTAGQLEISAKQKISDKKLDLEKLEKIVFCDSTRCRLYFYFKPDTFLAKVDVSKFN